MNRFLLPLFLSSLLSIVRADGDLFVAPSGTSTTCTDSADPCPTIQAALDVASEGAVIEIAEGEYTENLLITTDSLTLKGVSSATTKIVSAGGRDGIKAPEGVAVDVVVDILGEWFKIQDVSIVIPEGEANTKRDIGIFVRPPAENAAIVNVTVDRMRTGEPTMPGSRGLLVVQATGVQCVDSTFQGAFEDHIHLPTTQSTIRNNIVQDATRIGIVVIQETADSFSSLNTIDANIVRNSGTDGIQIQGDKNAITNNQISGSGGYGLYLCGNATDCHTDAPACVAPGTQAIASYNTVRGASDMFEDNALAHLVDKGRYNDVVLESDGSSSGAGKRAWTVSAVLGTIIIGTIVV